MALERSASFDSTGRRICISCNRRLCSVTCPVQQLPCATGVALESSDGDSEASAVQQCRGTTMAGARCHVTLESRFASAVPLHDGERYCAQHNFQLVEAKQAPDRAADADPELAKCRAIVQAMERSSTMAEAQRAVAVVPRARPTIARGARGPGVAGGPRMFSAATIADLYARGAMLSAIGGCRNCANGVCDAHQLMVRYIGSPPTMR